MKSSIIFSSGFDWVSTALAFLALYVAKYYYDYYTRENPLPGPFPLPVIGNLHQILFHKIGAIDMGTWCFHLHDKYGETFEFYLGPTRSILLGSPESLDKVYNPTIKNNFAVRPKLNGLSELGMDNGLLFNNNLTSWKRCRKFISRALSSPKFLRGFTDTTQDLFNKAERDLTFGKTIDFADWIRCFVMDILVSTSVGRNSGTCLLAYNTPKSEYTPEIIKSYEFLKLSKAWFESIPFFMAIPQFFRFHFPGLSSMNKRYLDNAKRLDEYILAEVVKRRKQLENLPEDQLGGVGILDILLTSNTRRDPNGNVESVEDEELTNDEELMNDGEPVKDEEPLKDEEIRDNLLDISIAGSDSTGNTFCYFIYYIARNPRCKERLLEEIDCIFADDMTRHVTYDDIEKLVYMDAALKETLRIFPVAPMTPRSLANPDTLLGYNWPAGQQFWVSQYSIMNKKTIWEDPYKFNPDRFLKDIDKIQKKCFIPFGGGSRICPGRNMATVELKTLFTLLYRKFDIELVDKNAPLNYTYAAVFQCKKLLVKLNQRK